MHIAFFDSGLGGLSIAKEVFDNPATRSLIHKASYIADTGGYPYGNKDAEWLKQRIHQVLSQTLQQLQPDLMVIACNTASTLALASLREHIAIPLVGVVPAIKPAAAIATGAIGILATPATVVRDYTSQLISDHANGHRVYLHGAAGLVEQAENKLLNRPINIQVIRDELYALFDQTDGHSIDTIVLACTHFPLLKNELAELAPKTIRWIDSGEAIARRIHQIAPSHGFYPCNGNTPVTVNFVTTGGGPNQAYEQAAARLCTQYLAATDCNIVQLHCPVR